MREYGFELRLAARIEQGGLPNCSIVPEGGLIARQLGTSVVGAGSRVMDLVSVAPGPAFEARIDLSQATIPPLALESDVPVGSRRPVTAAIDAPPDVARRVAKRAADVGFFELSRRGGTVMASRVTRYPAWFDGLVGIENKPDLSNPGALAAQLRQDVSLQVLDAVILATASHVTRAHRHRLPDPVGIWQVDPDAQTIEVVREPGLLDAEDAGFEILAEQPGQFDVDFVSSADKARQRRRIAERAYGKGWRTFESPGCVNFEPWTIAGTEGLPGCQWADRLVDPASECGADCPGFDSGPATALPQEAERARRTAWDPDPPGAARTQAFLDYFREE